MFEPLARSTVTQNVKIDSDSAESSDSCLRLWDGHRPTIACGDANKDQQTADSAQLIPGVVPPLLQRNAQQ